MTAVREAEQWLESRLRGAPPELAAEVRALLFGTAERGPVEELGGGPVADLLAAAGLAGLDEVAAAPGGRESALRLLAADAALTCAFEAAAGAGGDVARLCAAVGPSGALGRRLAASTPARGDGT
ncbi:MAG: hypothetical protein R6X22_09205 [Gemmatimonadota bacterium]|jgi:hypothetical protein